MTTTRPSLAELLAIVDGRDIREVRLFGPPGTGKTTAAAQYIDEAVDLFGPDKVLVVSFSRAASQEIAGRDISVQSEHVGTVHAVAYRMLNRPLIAECHTEEWNQLYPQSIIPSKNNRRVTAALEAGEDNEDLKVLDFEIDNNRWKKNKTGLDWLNEWNLARMRRHSLASPIVASIKLLEFAERWTKYKKERHLADFADMPEICLRDHKIGPGDPQVIFVDEAQDLAPLLIALIRSWGRHALVTMLFGDDDQTIYGWLGANPDVLLGDNLPEDQKIVLPQGYRMARAVHAYSQRFITQVRNRQHKIFAPRAEGGGVHYLPYTWKDDPEPIVRTAQNEIARGRKVMLLSSCGYMLKPAIDELRAHGLPFHNPYRVENHGWNPIRSGGGSAVERLTAWIKPLERPWTVEELWLAVEPLDTKGVLRRKAKTTIERNAKERPKETVTRSHLAELFEPGILDELRRAGDDASGIELIRWWEQHLLASKRDQFTYPLAIVGRHGLEALREQPQIVVGTIHSIKGTTTDTVIVFPDLSAKFMEVRFAPGGHDAMTRLFYVAITRARERVFLCRAASPGAVTWLSPIPGAPMASAYLREDLEAKTG